jgi:membrane-bound serine protease (ClpP class)
MTGLIIGMILLGILLVVLEILILPGMVAGIIGVIMIIAAISMGYSEYGATGGSMVLGGAVIGLVSAIIVSFKQRSWKRFGLSDAIDSHVNDVPSQGIKVGDIVLTISALRPAGTVQVNDRKIEAHTYGEWIDSNVEVEVVDVQPNKLIVKIKS